MAKKGIILFTNWLPLFSNLPDEDAGKLIKMICDYEDGKEIDTSCKSVYAMFLMMKPALDEADRNYKEKCEKNRENAKAGGLKKAENLRLANANQTVANGSERKAIVSERLPNNNNKSNNKSNIDKRLLTEKVVNAYHLFCPSLPKVIKITDKRIRAVNKLLKDFSEEDITTAFSKAEKNPFLRGEKKDWKADFDWLTDSTNLARVIEGKYDERNVNQKQEIKKSQYDFKAMQKWAEDN